MGDTRRVVTLAYDQFAREHLDALRDDDRTEERLMGYYDDTGSRTERDAAAHFFAHHTGERERPDPSEYRDDDDGRGVFDHADELRDRLEEDDPRMTAARSTWNDPPKFKRRLSAAEYDAREAELALENQRRLKAEFYERLNERETHDRRDYRA